MNNGHSKKKQQILETAAALFREKGYAASSMRELADAVNLKVSSLYSHFTSKEEILQTICMESAEKFTLKMQEIQLLEINPIQKLEALIDFHIQMATTETTSILAFNDEWRHLSPLKLNEFLAARKNYEKNFCVILELGKKEHLFQQFTTSTIFYTILGAIRWLYDAPKSKKQAAPSKELKQLLLQGIIKA